MLKGQRLILRPWNDEDLVFFQQLRNDVETQIELLAIPRPNPMHRVRKWLEDRSNAADGVFFVIASEAENRAIGFVELREIHPTHGWGHLGICLERSARGKGYAAEALLLLEDYARRVLMLTKVVLNVASTNSGARRFYDTAGYITVGVHRSHYKVADERLDAVVMEKLLNSEEVHEACAISDIIKGQRTKINGPHIRSLIEKQTSP